MKIGQMDLSEFTKKYGNRKHEKFKPGAIKQRPNGRLIAEAHLEPCTFEDVMQGVMTGQDLIRTGGR